jgi:hypothetical protein
MKVSLICSIMRRHRALASPQNVTAKRFPYGKLASKEAKGVNPLHQHCPAETTPASSGARASSVGVAGRDIVGVDAKGNG